ncbi:16S rRNA (guanine1207-N2)-methyltransferase [Microbacterium endophyticum]|uniref:16S rRNA (Guanine1207-N2)-methyltransferase n=1 Tax=Microbacterium endophyticum TaxID=1526412 RepID=A0A7W4V136_9MICO|nr:methyltransferase [Microbacterium endophyticum]MBB2974923.1 16S rRNA (guanine1207-N2)-methyltransferase [Microbacterium endophyticum]NIK37220.1 16S rRNA (guanine1207-N2)-methyltransferase [Microbacterium endophyticum]
MAFSFDSLRRWPDIEAPELRAWDAADTLILDESASARSELRDGTLVVIEDTHGALTLAAADAGASGIRTHQDSLTGERALHTNAKRVGLEHVAVSKPLDASLVAGARIVLLRLPRSLDALRDIAGLIAAHAAPGVVVYAGGRIKHMTPAMNDVLREYFDRVDVTHARQKSRVLIACQPHDGADPRASLAVHSGMSVCAFGGVFAGTAIDIGTRFLLECLPDTVPGGSSADPLIDMACGSGVVGATLALRHPDARVYASDQSAAAVASATATIEANGISSRVEVQRDDALSLRPDASASFIALNPPFHAGAAIHDSIAPRMFEDAARVLRPGGELWTVWNTSLAYRSALERIVGPTRQIGRNTKFTVTRSVRR